MVIPALEEEGQNIISIGNLGHGKFEDDSALDWVGDFEEKPHKAFLEKHPGGHNPQKDFPNLNISLKPDDLRPEFDKDFYATCNKAVDTVMRPTNNEIMELQDESGELDEWRKVLEDLRKRIQE